MALIDVTYSGTEGIVQPALGLAWEPGQLRSVEETFAVLSLGVDGTGGPFQRATPATPTADPAPLPIEAMPTEETVPVEPTPGEPAQETTA